MTVMFFSRNKIQKTDKVFNNILNLFSLKLVSHKPQNYTISVTHLKGFKHNT